MPQIDFAELKSRVSLEQAANYLNLILKPSGPYQLRGSCPQCKPDDDRILVLTPSKSMWCCHATTLPSGKKPGGDCIALVAHIKGVGFREAAQQLADHFGQPATMVSATAPQNQKPRTNGATPFDPETYLAKLDPHHESLADLNPDVLKVWGGYCTTGILRNTLALALRRADGQIMGFVGIDPATAKFPAIFKQTK